MEPKKGRFGNGQTTCEICGSQLDKMQELEIRLSHKASGKPLSKFWYAVPLCAACGGENSISMNVAWGQEVDATDLLDPAP
jgi:hypothetical protein